MSGRALEEGRWKGRPGPRPPRIRTGRAWDAAGCSAPPPPGPGACPSTWVGPRAPSQSPGHVGRGWGGTGGPGLRDTLCQHFTGVFVQPACAARGRLSLSLPPFRSFGRPSRTWCVRGSPRQASPRPCTGGCRDREGGREREAEKRVWGASSRGNVEGRGWGRRAVRPGSPRPAPVPRPLGGS